MNRVSGTMIVLSIIAAGATTNAADNETPSKKLDQYILGEWKMETRVLQSAGIVTYQQNPSIFVTDILPDGSFRVISSYTIRAVADTEGLLSRPECEGKTDCLYDTGSEGIGTLIKNKFYIYWVDDGWIDDVLTISGNKMSGDDGNGPINLTKVE